MYVWYKSLGEQSFRFSWVNTSAGDGWVVWDVYIDEKLLNCFPKWLYHNPDFSQKSL